MRKSAADCHHRSAAQLAVPRCPDLQTHCVCIDIANIGERPILSRLRSFMSLIRSAIALIVLMAAGVAETASVPAPAAVLAQAQLRVINHRFVSGFMRADGDFMETLTHSDFLLTDASGQWL